MIFSLINRHRTVKGLWARFKTLFFFLMVGVVLFSFHSRSGFQGPARSLFLDATALISRACQWPGHAFSSLALSTQSFFQVYAENKHLKNENLLLRHAQDVNLALTSENHRLRKRLNLIDEAQKDFISLPVIGGTHSLYQHNLLVKGGKREGIELKSPVLMGRHVLGRIVEVGNSFCRVLLVTDPHSHVPVVLEKSGAHGILSGDNTLSMRLKFLDNTSFPVEKGEYVFSSGQGGIFPAGFILGRIVEVTAHEILVRSMVEETGLDYVQIIKPFKER